MVNNEKVREHLETSVRKLFKNIQICIPVHTSYAQNSNNYIGIIYTYYKLCICSLNTFLTYIVHNTFSCSQQI